MIGKYGKLTSKIEQLNEIISKYHTIEKNLTEQIQRIENSAIFEQLQDLKKQQRKIAVLIKKNEASYEILKKDRELFGNFGDIEKQYHITIRDRFKRVDNLSIQTLTLKKIIELCTSYEFIYTDTGSTIGGERFAIIFESEPDEKIISGFHMLGVKYNPEKREFESMKSLSFRGN